MRSIRLGGRQGSLLRRRAERRVALVIGNADYLHVSDLPNAEVDAGTIADKLRELGFTVIFRLNQTHDDLVHAVGELETEMQAGGDKCDVAMLYYAGHGLQLSGENFIVPADYDGSAPVAQRRLFAVQSLMETMAHLSVRNLVFLDACRDRGGIDPRLIDESGAARPEFAGGLSKVALSRDQSTLVAFAADPGDVAEDGPYGLGSPFSNAIARHLSTRAVDLHDIMQWVANDVRLATGGRQRPWSYSNMTGDFHLVAKSWQPFWTMLALGALTALAAVFFGFDHRALVPHDVRKNPLALTGTMLFGLVLGYGVWRWGRRTWWAALVTVLAYIAMAGLGRLMLGAYGQSRDIVVDIRTATTSADFRALLATAEAREWVLVIMLAGTLIGLASVVSGALTTRSLRPLSRIAVGFMFGIASVAFYFAFLVFLQYLPAWAKGWEMAVVYLDTALWQAGLAANVGWAFTHHVERPVR